MGVFLPQILVDNTGDPLRGLLLLFCAGARGKKGLETCGSLFRLAVDQAEEEMGELELFASERCFVLVRETRTIYFGW